MTIHPSRQGLLGLLTVLVIARIAYGVQIQSVGAVGPRMIADLGLDYAALGSLVGAYSMLGLVLALPAGWLMARFGDRRIVLAGLGLMVTGGLLLAVTPGFGIALAGRLISGAGAVLLMVALPAIVADRFVGRALPAAMGTLLSGYPLGIGLGFILLPRMGSWRSAMAATAALALVSLIAASIALTRTPAGADKTRPSRLTARETGAVVAAGLVWGCPNAGFAVLLGFSPVFFVGQGMTAHAAGALVSLAAFATVPAGPFGGWLLGLMRRPVLGIAGGIVITAAAMLFLSQGIAPPVLLMATGLAIGMVAGAIVALPAAVLAPEHRALGMGLFWLIFFVPMTLLPAVAGLARDLTGDAAAPLIAASAFSALALIPLVAYVGFRRTVMAAADAG